MLNTNWLVLLLRGDWLGDRKRAGLRFSQGELLWLRVSGRGFLWQAATGHSAGQLFKQLLDPRAPPGGNSHYYMSHQTSLLNM